ncbi:MAG: mycofactocin biosynthesis peptidyl-dipeptidase MftE [Actinomycetota bacterium]|nr:mycofactocin biosynthesis peptidyl-dipeptidase MftE [Actinomycetota bacterium]
MALAASTSPEVPADALLVIPVGAVEQHGPHLPLDTDTRVACAVAHQIPAVVVGPALSYGASGEHEGFPGTVSLGAEALHAVLVELGRSACRWAARLAFVNGHGGNAPTLARAVQLLRSEGRDVAWWPCAVPATSTHTPDAHAGRTETSLLLHLDPSAVRWEFAAAGDTRAVAELMPELRAHGVRAVSPNGVLGDPTRSTAAEGERLMAELVARAAGAVAAWRPSSTGMLA